MKRIPRIEQCINRIYPQDRYLMINGLRLHYLDWGDRRLQPMLLLHGFTGHAHIWDNFASCFRTRYHITALDQRGHGDSEWSKEGSYSLDDHFSDIAFFVDTLKQERQNNLIIIGHSMGGRNALFYTAALPQNVSRLILIDARPGSNHRAENRLRYHLTKLPREANSFDKAAAAVKTLYPYLTWLACKHIAYYGYKRNLAGKVVPKYDGRMSEQLARSDYLIEELHEFLKHVACPTLLIRGEGSEFLSREDAKKMCELMPNAVLKEIPRSTHMPFLENPAAFTSAIWDFLKGDDIGATSA